MRSTVILAAIAGLPVQAQASTASFSIPEPSFGALFALGALGVIIGRQISKRRQDDSDHGA